MELGNTREELRKTRACAIVKPVEYYEEITGKSMDGLPESLRDGFARWWLAGIPAGSFLQAVIEGDLYVTMGKADFENRARLFEIVSWFYNYADTSAIRGNATEWGKDGGWFGRTEKRLFK